MRSASLIPLEPKIHIFIYIYILIDLLPNAELIIQKNGYACAMDIDGMLCQYGVFSNTFDLSSGLTDVLEAAPDK